MSLDDLAKVTQYPRGADEIETLKKVAQLYQSSEKFVRFLMTDAPKEKFPTFIDEVLVSRKDLPDDI